MATLQMLQLLYRVSTHQDQRLYPKEPPDDGS